MGNCITCIVDKDGVDDLVFEQYYTFKAWMHMNRVLSRYNKQTSRTFTGTFRIFKNIGIYHPYADSLLYLQQMKRISRLDYKM